jgi:hypothetical protein
MHFETIDKLYLIFFSEKWNALSPTRSEKPDLSLDICAFGDFSLRSSLEELVTVLLPFGASFR